MKKGTSSSPQPLQLELAIEHTFSMLSLLTIEVVVVFVVACSFVFFVEIGLVFRVYRMAFP